METKKDASLPEHLKSLIEECLSAGFYFSDFESGPLGEKLNTLPNDSLQGIYDYLKKFSKQLEVERKEFDELAEDQFAVGLERDSERSYQKARTLFDKKYQVDNLSFAVIKRINAKQRAEIEALRKENAIMEAENKIIARIFSKIQLRGPAKPELLN